MLNGWKTIIGATLAAIPLAWSAYQAHDWMGLVTVLGGWLTAIGFRAAMPKPMATRTPPPAALALLAATLCLAGCAATDTGQGEAAQGGSVGHTPSIAIYIGTGGGITTTIVPTPTAAPSAASTAEATSSAETPIDVAVDPEAVAGALSGVPLLGGEPPAPVEE